MKELPKKYCEKMQELLGEEYTLYRQSLEQDSYAALRINTNKISKEMWEEICPFPVTSVPWTEKGWYYDVAKIQPSKHPYYFAGLYYIQEPSAMIPASLLPIMPGNRILDLCAAPGGKATEIASRLQGKGILVANDISVSRAMALAKNIQMAGASNAVVTAEDPAHLAEYFPGYFDGILIDAPCSGEGMFRRDPRMIRDWLERGPEYYAKIQREILRSAYQMLRPGGYVVYSTCTFSPLEDEEMIGWFLMEYPDMQICPITRQPMYEEGRPEWAGRYQLDSLRHAVRIFPHHAPGEGHFAVLLQKEGNEMEHGGAQNSMESAIGREVWTRSLHHKKVKKYGMGRQKEPGSKKALDPLMEAERWLRQLHMAIGNDEIQQGSGRKEDFQPCCRLQFKKEQVILLPEENPDMQGLRMLQSGLIIGTVKKDRFEPSPQLALAVKDISDVPKISMEAGDIQVVKYLKGETIAVREVENAELLSETDGFLLVCVGNFPLGWAKWTSGGRLKNKYYAGWRLQ